MVGRRPFLAAHTSEQNEQDGRRQPGAQPIDEGFRPRPVPESLEPATRPRPPRRLHLVARSQTPRAIWVAARSARLPSRHALDVQQACTRSLATHESPEVARPPHPTTSTTSSSHRPHCRFPARRLADGHAYLKLVRTRCEAGRTDCQATMSALPFKTLDNSTVPAMLALLDSKFYPTPSPGLTARMGILWALTGACVLSSATEANPTSLRWAMPFADTSSCRSTTSTCMSSTVRRRPSGGVCGWRGLSSGRVGDSSY